MISIESDPIDPLTIEPNDPSVAPVASATSGAGKRRRREDAVEASWIAIEDVLDDATPVHSYDPGTRGPAEADRLVADVEGWHNPSA